MGIFDYEEDIEEIQYDDEIIDETENEYLRDSEKALELIGTILSKSERTLYEVKNLQKLDNILDVNLLGSLEKIQLDNEAKLQMKLLQLSDRLLEQKKYQVLKEKSIVGIGGKFSAGKSRFINSILNGDRELLPEDQNPTTSIPTYIVYGEKEIISAYTMENNAVNLDVSAMQALTHKFFEKYNMGFSAFINSLIIKEPNMPYQNIAFLDTPGYSKADTSTNSRLQKDLSDKTRASQQLKSVDYMIWLVDIENGVLSETDIDFILSLNIETPVLIVVNKADKKTDNEICEIVEQIRMTAQEAGIDCFVTAYSSRNCQEWNQENQIQKFLQMASEKRINRDDILMQIHQIEEQISQEIKEKISMKRQERNDLKDIIYQSDNIMEIKAVVNIYGEKIKDVRDMMKCKDSFCNNSKELENLLNKHFERN